MRQIQYSVILANVEFFYLGVFMPVALSTICFGKGTKTIESAELLLLMAERGQIIFSTDRKTPRKNQLCQPFEFRKLAFSALQFGFILYRKGWIRRKNLPRSQNFLACTNKNQITAELEKDYKFVPFIPVNERNYVFLVLVCSHNLIRIILLSNQETLSIKKNT